MAAAYLIQRGASAEQAIREVRRLRNASCVESGAQLDALAAFERSRR